MSHYEQRLEQDLAAIRARIDAVAARIEEAHRNAIKALLTLDRALASTTILGDLRINREIRAIDRMCHAFVARHLPSAGHLRFVSSVLRLNIGLERIGDYAVTICRETVQLSSEPPAAVARDIEMMADQSMRMLTQAMKAFHEGNADLARGTKGMADQLGTTLEKIISDLIREAETGSRPVRDLFALLVVFNRLERVSDQAKNVCEETVFAATGETKGPKVYRILFVDEHDDGLSQIAAAFAKKVFPGSGVYASAGWRPGSKVEPDVLAFMARHGIDPGDARPTKLETGHRHLADYHVIVALDKEAAQQIPEIPFHTVLLEWDVGPPPADGDDLEQAYKVLTLKIRELIEVLRGEEAS